MKIINIYVTSHSYHFVKVRTLGMPGCIWFFSIFEVCTIFTVVTLLCDDTLKLLPSV